MRLKANRMIVERESPGGGTKLPRKLKVRRKKSSRLCFRRLLRMHHRYRKSKINKRSRSRNKNRKKLMKSLRRKSGGTTLSAQMMKKVRFIY